MVLGMVVCGLVLFWVQKEISNIKRPLAIWKGHIIDRPLGWQIDVQSLLSRG